MGALDRFPTDSPWPRVRIPSFLAQSLARMGQRLSLTESITAISTRRGLLLPLAGKPYRQGRVTSDGSIARSIGFSCIVSASCREGHRLHILHELARRTGANRMDLVSLNEAP